MLHIFGSVRFLRGQNINQSHRRVTDASFLCVFFCSCVILLLLLYPLYLDAHKQTPGGGGGGGRQLGHGNESGHPTPCMVKHLRDEGARVTQIACGSRHTVVLTDLGKVGTGTWFSGRADRQTEITIRLGAAVITHLSSEDHGGRGRRLRKKLNTSCSCRSTRYNFFCSCVFSIPFFIPPRAGGGGSDESDCASFRTDIVDCCVYHTDIRSQIQVK